MASRSNDIAAYLEEHRGEWCFIKDIAKSVVRSGCKTSRDLVRKSLGHARDQIERNGSLVVPNLKAGKRRIDAYKVVDHQDPDADSVIKEMIQKDKRRERAVKKILRATKIIEKQALVVGEKRKELPCIPLDQDQRRSDGKQGS